MEFKVGMKVVCIHDFTKDEDWETVPKKGQILTIREFDEDEFLRFEEIINPVAKYVDSTGECSFPPNKFVPLISTFKRITFSEVTELVEVGEN